MVLDDTGIDKRSIDTSRLSRRRFLGALGVGGAGLAAGCSGDGGSGDAADGTGSPTTADPGEGNNVTVETATPRPTDTGTPQPETIPEERTGEPKEPRFDLSPEEKPPQDWNMNPFGNSTYSPLGKGLVHTMAPPGANAANTATDYIPVLIAENELIDGSVWRLKLSEGFTWHDGKPVTIEDLFFEEKYLFLRDKKFGRSVKYEKIEQVDDRTMEFTLREKKHPIIWKGLNDPQVRYPKREFEGPLEAIKDATSKREAYLTNKEYVDKSFPIEDHVGHGLWKIKDVGENRILYEQFEDFPSEWRKRQNIQEVRLPISQGATAAQLAIKNNQLDWAQSKLDVTDPPDTYKFIKKKGTKQYEWKLNHTNKHLARRGVRRALCYIIDTHKMAQGKSQQYGNGVFDGTTPAIGNRWVPNYEERIQNYIDYTGGSFPKKAATEMKRAGYEKNSDGWWVGPDGDVAQVDVRWGWWHQSTATTIGQFMKQFGIKASVEEYGGPFWADYGDFTKDWDIVPVFHSRGPNHPASSYGNQAKWATQMWKLDEDGNKVPAGNRKLEVEIPTELGAKTVDGNGRTINIVDLQDKITDPEATKEDMIEPTKTLSWWYNFWVPDLIMFGGYFAHLGDFENFGWLDYNGDGLREYPNRSAFQFGLNTGYVFAKSK